MKVEPVTTTTSPISALRRATVSASVGSPIVRPHVPSDSAIAASRDGGIARRPGTVKDVNVKLDGNAERISMIRRASLLSPIATT